MLHCKIINKSYNNPSKYILDTLSGVFFVQGGGGTKNKKPVPGALKSLTRHFGPVETMPPLQSKTETTTAPCDILIIFYTGRGGSRNYFSPRTRRIGTATMTDGGMAAGGCGCYDVSRRHSAKGIVSPSASRHRRVCTVAMAACAKKKKKKRKVYRARII